VTPGARHGDADLATADGHDRYVPSQKRDILSAGHEGVYEWAVEHHVHSGARFLDFGCGTGYGAALVIAAGGIFDGADASPAAIEYAQANYATTGVRFFVADLMEPLPADVAPESYDVVFSSEVLEHVVDPFAFVGAMAGFVRDDGVALVGTPNRLWSKENMAGGELLSRSHVMEFTPQALVALLRTSFADVTLLYRVFPPEAIQTTLVTGDRPRLLRAAVAFAREVAPGGLSQLRRVLPGQQGARQWSPADIEWLRAEDAGLDMARCVGLVAVCRAPRR
jgi:SAM-dependent methyltransferase